MTRLTTITRAKDHEYAQLFRLSLLVLLLLSFAWRVHHLAFQSLWRDEIDAVWFAMRDLPQTLSMFVSSGQNGPLYFLSLRPWLSLVGSSEYALRFPSAVAGTLAIPIFWQVARRLLSGNHSDNDQNRFAWLAFGAALLLSGNPYQLWYSQEGKMYALITSLALFATWAWLRGIEQGGWRNWLTYLCTVSLAIYCHLLMILIIPLHFVWFVIAWPQAKTRWRGYGLALAGLTLPYLPMVWWQWELLMAQDKRTGFIFTPLPEMLETLGWNHNFGFAPHLDLIWLAPLIFLIFAGLLLGWENEQKNKQKNDSDAANDDIERSPGLANWRSYLLILSWLLLPILEIYTLSLRQPVYTDRYIIWIAPAAMILIMLGVRSLWSVFGRVGVPVSILLILFVLAIWINKGWQQKTTILKFDLRAAVHLVSQERAEGALLILQIPHTQWAYRYYSGKQDTDPFAGSDGRLAHWEGGLWTNTGTSDVDARNQVARTMKEITTNANDIWVILSEPAMWDNRRLMDKWLDDNLQRVETNDFYGVQVRHYTR